MKKFGFGGESSIYVFIAAVAIFCIILGFSLGATWRGSISETAPFGWTEFWLNRYQTALTIFAAIFIAMQQINLARRQHRSNVKIETLDRLRAIAISKNKMQTLSKWEVPDTVIISMKEQGIRIFTPFDSQHIEYISQFLHPSVFSAVNMIDKHFCGITTMIENDKSVSIDTIKVVLEIGRNLAKQVIVQLDNEEQSILSLEE